MRILFFFFFEKWTTHPLWVGVPFNLREWGLLNIDSMVDKLTVLTTFYIVNPNIHSTTLMPNFFLNKR